MKLLLDEMLDKEIAVQLRARGREVRAVQEEPSLRGLSDVELLRVATAAEEAVVTDDVADVSLLHTRLLGQAESHAGVMLASPARFPRRTASIGLWVDALDTALREAGAGAMTNRVVWLQPAGVD